MKKAGYIYYEGNGYTPLGSGATSLNWVFEDDGYCYAVFNGGNQNAIMSDMGKLFPKVNVAAGRDIRRISSNNTQVTYSEFIINSHIRGSLDHIIIGGSKKAERESLTIETNSNLEIHFTFAISRLKYFNENKIN